MSINTIVRRKLRVLAGCLLIILVGILAGCGGDTSRPDGPDTDTTAVTASECSTDDTLFQTCVVTMTDTRRVTCIVSQGSRFAAMSCDWDHADGADKGWE